MLRIIGIITLLIGCIGLGLSLQNRMKDNLSSLNRIRQIFLMLQNEIIYSKASLPEACKRIGERTQEPYKSSFYQIYEIMAQNRGDSFSKVWKDNMSECTALLPLAQNDKNIFLSFGDCAGFMDGKMQADAIEQYIHDLDLSVKKLEEEMAGKSKVIMSLSVMGGLLAVIILI